MQSQFFHLPLFTLLLSLLIAPVSAQQNSGTRSSSSPVAVADKTGQEAVCDGALEIIPSGTVTFARKRYIPATPRSKSSSKLAKPRLNGRR